VINSLISLVLGFFYVNSINITCKSMFLKMTLEVSGDNLFLSSINEIAISFVYPLNRSIKLESY
jgi:hypothetical protein